MPDRAARTPNQTGEWAITSARCESYASRLTRAETEKRARTSRHHDPVGADVCREQAERFRAIVDRIEAWRGNPARKAAEKTSTYVEVGELQRWAEDTLRAMGSGW